MTQALTPHSNGGAVEKSAKRDLAEWFQSAEIKQKLAMVLPSQCKTDRHIGALTVQFNKNPKLLECEKMSIYACFMTASQLGIEVDGRRAHLIPFENRKKGITECTLIIDYKGLVELVYRTGNVAMIHADMVCEFDEFEYDKGIVLRHKIDFRKERGKAFAFYAMIRFKDGTEKYDVMTREDVDDVRARSRGKDSAPWTEHYVEMAKKTVFRRLAKWVPLSPEQRDAVEADDDVIDLPPSSVSISPAGETVADLRKSLGAPEPESPPAPDRTPRKQSPKPHVNIPTQPAPEPAREPEPQLTEPDPFAVEPAIEAQAELMPAESAEDAEAKERIQLDELFPEGERWDALIAYALGNLWIKSKSEKIPRNTVMMILQNPQDYIDRVMVWWAAHDSQPAPKATPAPVADAPRSERQVKMGELGEFLSELDPEKAILFATRQGMIQNGDWATISDANLNKILASKTVFKTRVANQK